MESSASGRTEPTKMFAGQVAIVTGAGRGIGRAEALALARHGARVVVNSRSSETTAATAAAIRAAGGEAIEAAGDVADDEVVRAIVERAVAEFGRLDILVNNAGAGAEFMNRPVETMPFAHWDRIHDTHLRATYVFCHYAITPMRERGYGRIINTASMHGLGGGRAGIANYTSAKAGVMGLTRNLAKEIGPLGITANAVAPGFVHTEFFDTYPREFITQIERQNPMRRLGRPDEVADLVCFLASPQAAYINGAIIPIDGGRQEYAIEPVKRAEGGGERLT